MEEKVFARYCSWTLSIIERLANLLNGTFVLFIMAPTPGHRLLNALREKPVVNNLFALFMVASLITPSWRYGPFSWWPIGGIEVQLAGGPVRIGVLNLLPVLVVLAWAVIVRRSGSWRWGARQITFPLLLYTVWSSIRLWDAPPRYLFVYGGGLLLLWFTYLYVVNQRPPLAWMLGVVLLVQSTVGILQFILQRDLGLTLLGELQLNPLFAGVTVVEARGQHWLRAYGLTAHPNLYGALLAACILLLVLYDGARSETGKNWLWGIAGLGISGLFLSFSRAAWLGLAVGVGSWFYIRWRRGWRPTDRHRRWLVVLIVILSGMLIVYGDLALNRFINLQNPLEARSITQRVSDARIALQLVQGNLWSGVGYGRYVDAAAAISDGAARVHNVFLLTAAELGLPGLLIVIWLLVGPLLAFRRLYQRRFSHRVASGMAPWVLLLIVNQLDTTLWISGNWQTAILFGLAAAHVSQHLAAPIDPSPRQMGSAEADNSAK